MTPCNCVCWRMCCCPCGSVLCLFITLTAIIWVHWTVHCQCLFSLFLSISHVSLLFLSLSSQRESVFVHVRAWVGACFLQSVVVKARRVCVRACVCVLCVLFRSQTLHSGLEIKAADLTSGKVDLSAAPLGRTGLGKGVDTGQGSR